MQLVKDVREGDRGIMRVMLDTNILISAIYKPQSVPALAYYKASSPDNDLVLCDQILDELRRIFNRKFPAYIPQLERFLSIAQYELVQTDQAGHSRSNGGQDTRCEGQTHL